MSLFHKSSGHLVAFLLLPLLANCTGFATGFVSDGNTTRAKTAAVSIPGSSTSAEPVLTSEGTCSAPAPVDAQAIAPGIGECDLVRLKGTPPTDVLIGQGGIGQREVQVMYSEPGGRELYFFTANKLTRVFKPGQG
jgi:hypothetical protein